MQRRLFNLTILASWLFAWSSAALHHHGHDHGCHHHDDVATAEPEAASCSHDHHHDHGPTTEEEDAPVWVAECRLCELLALNVNLSQTATLDSTEFLTRLKPRLDATEPVGPQPRNWRGRAPPLSCERSV